MRVLVTGALGNVGRSAIKAIQDQGDELTIYDLPTTKNRRLAKKHLRGGAAVWGDIRDYESVKNALRGQDFVIHLAAIIPPASIADTEKAREVNVGGTRNVLRAIAETGNKAVLVFCSSVAVYGARIEMPFVRVDDRLAPCPDDDYARQKLECEQLIRQSAARWSILRLSYIVWKEKLQMNTLMYRMPLATAMEVCHTLDTGLALAHAVGNESIIGKTLNIGGGPRCRVMYRDYLDRMFRMFGLGCVNALPEAAFSAEGFHCAFMDTREAERHLRFQTRSIEVYYKEVAGKTWFIRPWAALARPLARAWLLSRSPYLKKA